MKIWNVYQGSTSAAVLFLLSIFYPSNIVTICLINGHSSNTPHNSIVIRCEMTKRRSADLLMNNIHVQNFCSFLMSINDNSFQHLRAISS